MPCKEQVSFAEIEILNTMVKGLYDNKTREEVLAKSPEMDLLTTIAFIEAKETVKRSAGVLTEASMASSQLNKIGIQYKSGDKPKDESKEKCSYCGRTGHRKRGSLEIRKEKCKAYGVTCNKCSKVNHYEKQCLSKLTASANNLRLGRVKVRDGGKQPEPHNTRNIAPLDHMTYDQARGKYV